MGHHAALGVQHVEESGVVPVHVDFRQSSEAWRQSGDCRQPSFWTRDYCEMVSCFKWCLAKSACLCPQDMDVRKLKEGNATLRASLKVIQACISTRTPCAIENLKTSLMFRVPELEELSASKVCQKMHVDMCAFGQEFKKATMLCVWCAGPLPDENPYRCRVKRTRKQKVLCRFSQQPHLRLSFSTGKEKTIAMNPLIAQCYCQKFGQFAFRLLIPADPE